MCPESSVRSKRTSFFDSLTLTELQLELLRGAQRSGIDVEEFQYDMRLINKLSLGELRALLPGLSDPSFGRDGLEFVRGVARDRIVRLIQDAERIPVERDALYNEVRVYAH